MPRLPWLALPLAAGGILWLAGRLLPLRGKIGLFVLGLILALGIPVLGSSCATSGG